MVLYEHYSTTKDGFQVQDMLRHLGIDKDFYFGQMQSNIYVDMVKKNGKNRKDLLKAIHYIVLLMSSEDGNLNKGEHIKQQIEKQMAVDTDIFFNKDDVNKNLYIKKILYSGC